jgi:hypothetical protein
MPGVVGQVRVNLDSAMPTGRPAAQASDGVVRISAQGCVDGAEAAYAVAAVCEVLAESRLRDGARVRLSGGVCAGGPALMQVNLRVNGAPARVQLAGATPTQTVDETAHRLRRQLRRLTTAYEPWPWPDPQRRPLGVPMAGTVRRHKNYRLHVGSPCQAAAFMNAMDYDVMLFVDAETGEDAVVYRSGPTGVRLARQHSMRPPSLPTLLPLTVNAHRVPALALPAAVDRLVAGWLPFVFYTDADSGRGRGRGRLLYRRYDGDLGLITPA